MHWSESFVQFLRRVVPEVADVPLYLLKAGEDGTEWLPEWMAAFSPLADLQAQTVLERLGQWCGRGICIRVREDFESWSSRLKAGTLLHELAHGLEFLNQPNALVERIELSPVAREMLNGSESEILAEAGICRNELMKGQHGPNFIRLACHLHWRARTEIPLAASDLQFLHKVYSLDSERYEDVLNALAGELAMSRNLNLRRLRQAPESFTELFR